MATIVVNGTSIQTAANAAASGDTLDVKSGGYAGFTIPTGKKLTIIGAGSPPRIEGQSNVIGAGGAGSVLRNLEVIGKTTGVRATDLHRACVAVTAHDVTLDALILHDHPCYGVRSYQADRTILTNSKIYNVAVGYEQHRGGAGGVIRHNEFRALNRMVIDDGTNATTGGVGVQLYDSAAGIVIEDNDITGGRAKTVGGSSWKYDGGAFEGYGVCGKATFRLNRIRDCVNIMEVGTDASHPGVPTDWVIEDNEAWGNPGLALDESKGCVGFFLRSNNRMIIQRNKFHELDDFVIRLTQGGFYGGPMTGNVVRNNDIWVKPGNSLVYGKNRAYVVDQAIVPANWGAIDGNRIYFDPAVSPEVAYYGGGSSAGGKGATKDLNTWKTWTGWGTGETWGAVVVPPPPVDPCLAIKAERDVALANLAATNVALLAARAERDAATAKVNQAKALGAQVKTLGDQIAGL